MSDLIKRSQFQPRYIPYLGNTEAVQIDRAQTLDPSGDYPSVDDKELGTKLKLGTTKETSVIGCSLTQREYGSIEFYRALANKTSGTVTLDDFASSAGDINAYIADSDDAIVSTLWYPRQRLVSLGLSIGDPEALVDRSFTFIGEDAITLKDNNKYLIYKKKTLTAPDIGSGDIAVITVEDPVAEENPDKAGKYMLRVLRVKAGITSELSEGTGYTSTANALTVQDCAVDDVIKYYYSASSWVTSPVSPFITNVSDLNSIRANQVVLYLGSANRIYKIQSGSISADLSREDISEIGNVAIIARSVLENAVSIDLGKLLDSSFTLEEVLRGNTSGLLDSSKYATDLTFSVAVYSDSTHSTFLLGYKSTNCSVSASRPGTGTIDANVDSGYTLKSDNLLITNQIGDLGL